MSINYNARVVSDGLLACWDAGNPKSATDVNKNLLSYAEDISSWTQTGSTVISNAAIAPNGSYTADKLVGNSGVTGRKSVYQTASIPVNTTCTFSVYLKSADYTTAMIWFDTANSLPGPYQGADSLINLSLGTISAGRTVITPVGNNWYRLAVTASSTSTTFNFQIALGDANGSGTPTGDGINGIYVWGAQLEVGSTATDYKSVGSSNISSAWNDIVGTNNATLVSTVRYRESGTAKSLYFNGANRSLISSALYNQQYTGKTVFAVVRMDPNAGTGVFRGIIGGSGSVRSFNTYMYNDGAGWRIHWSTGGNFAFSGGFSSYLTTLTTNQWFIIAVSQETNGNTNYYLNGVNVGSFTGYAFFQYTPVVDPEYIGGSDGQWYGDIAYVSLYKKALTAAEIQQNTNALRGRFSL